MEVKGCVRMCRWNSTLIMMDSVMPYGGGVLGQLAIVDKAGEVDRKSVV